MSTTARARLLPVAACVSLLVFALGATGLFSLHLTNLDSAAAAARMGAIEAARHSSLEARAAFKTQVQEWKNLLLRGRTPADLAEWRGRFERQEALVRAELEGLRASVPELGPPGPSGGASPDVPALLAEHARLGEAYRAALAGLVPEDFGSARRVDAAVRGADRGLSDELDAFAAKMEAGALAEARAIRAAAAGRYEALRRATWIASALAVLGSLWLVFLANRAARA